jgi:hypothetical protein
MVYHMGSGPTPILPYAASSLFIEASLPKLVFGHNVRSRIKVMLRNEMSLEQIADRLNARKIPRPYGDAAWSAATVRSAYVS